MITVIAVVKAMSVMLAILVRIGFHAPSMHREETQKAHSLKEEVALRSIAGHSMIGPFRKCLNNQARAFLHVQVI